jgi:hypothetical protein
MSDLVTSQCPICFEEIYPAQTIMSHATQSSVHHVFHKTCLNDWFSTASHRQCPTCSTAPPEFKQSSSLIEDITLLAKVVILIPTMPFILGSLIAKEV